MSLQRKIRLVVLAAAAAGGAVVLLAAYLSRGSATPQALGAVVVLGTLVAVSRNLEVDVRSGAGMSGSVIIVMASLVVFRENAFYLGPAIVGICAGIDIAQIKRREWEKVAFNASLDCLTLVAASTAFWALIGGRTFDAIPLLVAGAAAGLVDLLMNASLLSVPVSITSGEKYRSVMFDVLRFHISSFPLVFLGLGIGWVYLQFGILVVPLIVAPILVARRAFVSYSQLRGAQENTIEALIRALEAKDPYTAGHAHRVAQFAGYMAEELHFGLRRCERLRYAALMHDIGKLIVPNQLLNKPARLTAAEFDRVHLHESVSVELLERIDFLAPVAADMTTEAATVAVEGGLIEPAIIHVADAFDAMTSTRPYRKALSQQIAMDELRKGAGTQFNGLCVEALIRAVDKRGETYGAGHEIKSHAWEIAPEASTGSAGLGDFLAADQSVTP